MSVAMVRFPAGGAVPRESRRPAHGLQAGGSAVLAIAGRGGFTRTGPESSARRSPDNSRSKYSDRSPKKERARHTSLVPGKWLGQVNYRGPTQGGNSPLI